MRVLVTGGSGFLGSHIAEVLAQGGHAVRALVRRSSNRKFLESLRGIEFAYGSVDEPTTLPAAVANVDAIIHAAGLVKARSQDEFLRVNAEGTRHLLAAAASHAPNLQRFVHVSSLAVAGPSLDGSPHPADREPKPVTHYGRSKLAAEREVLAYKERLPVVIVRPPTIYGPRDTEVFAIFKAIRNGILPTLGDVRARQSIVYAPDAARACIQAMTAKVASGATYHLDDGGVYEMREMFDLIEQALGKRALVRFALPSPVVYLAAWGSETYGRLTNKAVIFTRDKLNELTAPNWVCSSADTQRDLEWTPEVKLPEGMKKTVAWYREQGWL